MGKLRIAVLDVLPLPGRGMILLELDAPVPVIGLNEGTLVDLELGDGTRRQTVVKSMGFASSTPDHAHVVVPAGTDGPERVAALEFDPT